MNCLDAGKNSPKPYHNNWGCDKCLQQVEFIKICWFKCFSKEHKTAFFPPGKIRKKTRKYYANLRWNRNIKNVFYHAFADSHETVIQSVSIASFFVTKTFSQNNPILIAFARVSNKLWIAIKKFTLFVLPQHYPTKTPPQKQSQVTTPSSYRTEITGSYASLDCPSPPGPPILSDKSRDPQVSYNNPLTAKALPLTF